MNLFLLLLMIVLSGCGRSYVNYYHIQPLKDREGFIAVESVQLGRPTPPKRIAEIDSNGNLTYLPTPLPPGDSFLYSFLLVNDSTAVVSFAERKNYRSSHLALLHLKTGETHALAEDYEPVAISNKGNFIFLRREDSTSSTAHLYQLDNTLTYVLSISHTSGRPAALADNNFFVATINLRNFKEHKPTNYLINTESKSRDTVRYPAFVTIAYPTSDTSILYLAKGSGERTPLHKYFLRDKTETIILDSMNIQRCVQIPHSDLLLFRGSTLNEYRTESEEIGRSIAEFLKRNPDIVCALPAEPTGYWRLFNMRTRTIQNIDDTFEYVAATTSGKHILVHDKDDRTKFSVLKTSEIIE